METWPREHFDALDHAHDRARDFEEDFREACRDQGIGPTENAEKLWPLVPCLSCRVEHVARADRGTVEAGFYCESCFWGLSSDRRRAHPKEVWGSR